MAEDIKNLCAPIPSALHAQVRENQEASGKTLGQYMTWLITQFYEYEKGGTPNMQTTREPWHSRSRQICSNSSRRIWKRITSSRTHSSWTASNEPLQMRQNKCSTMPCR